MCQKLKESNGLASASPTLTQTPAAGNVALFQQEITRLNGLLQDKMMECERLSRERDDSKRRDQECIQMLEQQVFIIILNSSKTGSHCIFVTTKVRSFVWRAAHKPKAFLVLL